MEKRYEFNKYDVCVNADIVKIDEYVEIRLAQMNDGRWCCGYSYNYSSTFASSPCMSLEWMAHNTREDALKGTIADLISYIERNRKTYQDNEEYITDVKRMSSSIRRLKEYLFDLTHVQLTLF